MKHHHETTTYRMSMWPVAAWSFLFLVSGFLFSAGILRLFAPVQIPSVCQSGFACPYGLLYRDAERSSPGFTLLSGRRWNTVYLLDWAGNVAHEWKIPGVPSAEVALKNPRLIGFGLTQAKLLPNGHLLVGHGTTEAVPISERAPGAKPAAGTFPVLKELDWDGNVAWAYSNEWMHHDFEPLPNGNIAVIVWETLPKEFAARVQGGISGSEFQGNMYSDAIVEVDRGGNEVWRWSVKDHIAPDDPEYPWGGGTRDLWSHLDNLVHVEKNPVTGTPAYLVSFNKFDTLALIERSTGNIIWHWGPGVLAGQHSVDLTDDGKIITFDTGAPRARAAALRGDYPAYLMPFSRVLAVDPGSKTIVFDFLSGLSLRERALYFTPVNGGVQALSGGTILVSDGTKGRVFEIDPAQHRVVWDYRSPFGFPSDELPSLVEAAMFSAFRYPAGYAPQFGGLELK